MSLPTVKDLSITVLGASEDLFEPMAARCTTTTVACCTCCWG